MLNDKIKKKNELKIESSELGLAYQTWFMRSG